MKPHSGSRLQLASFIAGGFIPLRMDRFSGKIDDEYPEFIPLRMDRVSRRDKSRRDEQRRLGPAGKARSLLILRKVIP